MWVLRGGDASYYGTFDQGGNVWEWNDAIVSANSRGLRGGVFNYKRFCPFSFHLTPRSGVSFFVAEV